MEKKVKELWDYAPDWAKAFALLGHGISGYWFDSVEMFPDDNEDGTGTWTSEELYHGEVYRGPDQLLPKVPWRESLQVRPKKNESVWDYAPDWAKAFALLGDETTGYWFDRIGMVPCENVYGVWVSSGAHRGAPYDGPAELIPKVPWRESLQVRPKKKESVWDYAPDNAVALAKDRERAPGVKSVWWFYEGYPKYNGKGWNSIVVDRYKGPDHLLPDVEPADSLMFRPEYEYDEKVSSPKSDVLGKDARESEATTTANAESPKPKIWPDDYELVQSAIYNLYGGREFRTMEPGEGWQKSEALLLDADILDPASLKELRTLGFTVSCLEAYLKYTWKRIQMPPHPATLRLTFEPCKSLDLEHRKTVLEAWPNSADD